MITTLTTNKTVERSEQFEEKTFSFKADAKSFRIVIANLYSNPVRAILAELGQNASDAHTAIKKHNRPFEIQLPNSLDPNLIVRDFGCSMSHDFMMNEYAIAFCSSKDKTNKFSGAFGIGRLSLLALTESYICTCYLNGTKRSYSVFYNEHGIPSIVYMGEEATKEENGFEVNAPISSEHHYSFERMAQDVYRFYKVKPIIRGDEDFKFYIHEYSYQKDNTWMIFPPYKEFYAIMGGYAYKLDKYSLGSKELGNDARKILDQGGVFYFKNGDLTSAANREVLTYDTRTIKKIKEALDDMVGDLCAHAQKKFAECKNLYEIRCVYRELTSGRTLLPLDNDTLKKTIPEQYRADCTDYIGLRVLNNTENQEDKTTLYAKQLSPSQRDNSKFYCGKVYDIVCSWKRPFFINDDTKHALARVRQFMEANKQYEGAYVFDNEWIHIKGNLKKLYTHLGCDASYFIKASTLPLTQIVREKRAKSNVWKFSWGKNIYNEEDYWTTDYVDLKSGGYYVPFKRYTVEQDNYSYHASNIQSMRELISKENDNTSIVVYGANQRILDNVKKRNNWKNLIEEAKPLIKKYGEEKHFDKAGVKQKILRLINSNSDYSFFHHLAMKFKKEHFTLKMLSISPFIKFTGKLFDIIGRDYTIKPEEENHYHLYQQFFAPEQKSLDDILKDLFNEVDKYYPMLKECRGLIEHHHNYNTIFDYINEKDALSS